MKSTWLCWNLSNTLTFELSLPDLWPCSYNGPKHLKVVQKNNQYGFSAPCTYPTLMALVLFYSANSLVQHNPSLTTTLEHPINAWDLRGAPKAMGIRYNDEGGTFLCISSMNEMTWKLLFSSIFPLDYLHTFFSNHIIYVSILPHLVDVVNLFF